MKVYVNGLAKEIEPKETLDELLKKLGYRQNFFAVAVNLVCVPRAEYGKTYLKEADQLEILSARQGG